MKIANSDPWKVVEDRDRLKKLCSAQSQYISVLEAAISNSATFLLIHSWAHEPEIIATAERLRGEIKSLSAYVKAGEGFTCSDLLALVAWLAGYQEHLNSLRYDWIAMIPEECRASVILKWPLVQGTRNQINLKSIGDMPWTSEQVSRAVDQIIKANAGVQPPANAGCDGTPC
jgi:hypothetical protein